MIGVVVRGDDTRGFGQRPGEYPRRRLTRLACFLALLLKKMQLSGQRVTRNKTRSINT